MASAIKEIKNPWIRTLAEYGLITVSIWIMVIGIYFFKFPNHFAFGGVTGFSTVFSQLLHCSASTFTTVANYALLVYFFRIMAMTSVPPEDASMLNRIAEPIAGSIMANTSSSIGWSVRVPCIGTRASSACKLTDITMVA